MINPIVQRRGGSTAEDEGLRWCLTKTDKKPPKVHATAEELQKAESHIPDGPSAIAHEACLFPWVLVSLAVLGVALVAVLMGVSGGGWRAVLLGEVWLLMGYAVSWIVVWGAGVMRARDEHEIEEHIIHDEHRLHVTR